MLLLGLEFSGTLHFMKGSWQVYLLTGKCVTLEVLTDSLFPLLSGLVTSGSLKLNFFLVLEYVGKEIGVEEKIKSGHCSKS